MALSQESYAVQSYRTIRSKALAECQARLLHHRMRHEVCKLKLSDVRKLSNIQQLQTGNAQNSMQIVPRQNCVSLLVTHLIIGIHGDNSIQWCCSVLARVVLQLATACSTRHSAPDCAIISQVCSMHSHAHWETCYTVSLLLQDHSTGS